MVGPVLIFFSIHLAAEEAIVNAIVHGNKLSADKKVHVECFVSPTTVRIEITDEGDGFKPEEVPDCTQDDRLEVPNGRGVMLIHNFMTRVEYNEKGKSCSDGKGSGCMIDRTTLVISFLQNENWCISPSIKFLSIV